MSLIKLKQVAGPIGNEAGSFVVYDGTSVKWTADITSGIQIPAGNTLERPLQPNDGFTRYNTDIEGLETYINGEWVKAGGEVDTTRIESTDNKTDVSTEEVANTITFTANEKRVLDITSDALSVSGEKLTLKNIDDEVQFLSSNTAATGDVDIRFVPQDEGLVFFGILGDGIVESEDTFDTFAKGGAGKGGNAGDIIVVGGSAEEGNYNGGSVIIKGGKGLGTGENGNVSVADPDDNKIAEFVTRSETDTNWLAISNGESDADDVVNGVIVGIAADSASTDVNIYLEPKGDGLVLVSDLTAYTASLAVIGNQGALVTKKFVSDSIAAAGLGIEAGVGLVNNDGDFDVVTGTTVGINGSNALIVKSSDTENQILFSTGFADEEAEWGDFNLADAYVTGTLPSSKGGTGQNTFAAGDMLVGLEGALTKLTLGTEGSVLIAGPTAPIYSYISTLKNSAGNVLVSATGPTTPANTFTMVASNTNGAIEFGAAGLDNNVSIRLAPKGTGLVFMKSGYTATIGADRETVVTKGFVDDSIIANTETLMRRQEISSGWTSQMNIGALLPVFDGREVLISRVMLQVNTAVAGNGVVDARIYANTTALTTISETDIGVTGTYIVELNETLDASGRQLKIVFLDNSGTTEATPSVGNIEVSVYYKVV